MGMSIFDYVKLSQVKKSQSPRRSVRAISDSVLGVKGDGTHLPITVLAAGSVGPGSGG